MARLKRIDRPEPVVDVLEPRRVFSAARRAFSKAYLDVYVPHTAEERSIEAAYVAACDLVGRRPGIDAGRMRRG